MSDSELVIVEVDLEAREALSLIAELDRDLRDLYPGEPIHGIEPAAFRSGGGVFLLGTVDGVAVACGALRPLGDKVGEVKRMFVRKEYRGRGFARAILSELERVAKQRGYRGIRLETGDQQPAAISLYETAGYTRTPGWTECHSLRFEKLIFW